MVSYALHDAGICRFTLAPLRWPAPFTDAYDRIGEMKAAARFFVLVLAVAVAGAPVLLNGCLLNCQRPEVGSHHASGSIEHGCHHAAAHSDSPYHVRGDSKRCSHEHGQPATQVAAATDGGSRLTLLQAPMALVACASAREVQAAFAAAPPFRLSPGSPIASSFAAPLRV